VALIFPEVRPFCFGLCRCLILLLPSLFSALALSSEPIYVKNLSPVSGLLGLPSQRSAFTTGSGSFAAAIHSSIANHSVQESRSVEAVNIDGETLRIALEARLGIAENWDIQLEIPWLDHSGGNLDRVIENWHDLLGMSDGGRPDVDQDLLGYRYLAPGASFAFEDTASGLGDITVSLNHAFFRTQTTTAGLALGYKFDTAKEQDFLGSGSGDIFLALRFSGDHLADLPLTWHGQLGYLRAGDVDVLGSRQEKDLWFAGLALDWGISESVSLLAQVDAHAAPVDSDLTALGDDAVLLSLGLRWQFAREWSLDFNFIEDVRIETAPDITFQTSLRYRLGQGRY
jgi:hypothetical protein